MYFRNYGLRKRWLEKCLKGPVSQDPLRGKVGNGRKHFFNLNGNTFTIFIDQCEVN